MSTRAELCRLLDLDDKKGLMREIGDWEDEEAAVKRRDLWIRAVRGWCEGREVWYDDRTVVNAGELTTVREN
jgi:hypothetical protein